MSAPTYRDFTHIAQPRRVGLLRWACEVHDGYTGPTLLTACAHTREGARTRAVIEAAGLRRWDDWMREQLAEVVERLRADGIDVEARVDHGRVCVWPCCPCSDPVQAYRQRCRAVLAFAPVAGAVCWEVAR